MFELIIGILIGLAGGILIAVLAPKLWKKGTDAAAKELKKPAP